jgi:hypothetical protein
MAEGFPPAAALKLPGACRLPASMAEGFPPAAALKLPGACRLLASKAEGFPPALLTMAPLVMLFLRGGKMGLNKI